MEQWEEELRKKLHKTLPDGAYHHEWEHEGRKMNLHTGKGGEIEIRVEMAKQLREWAQSGSTVLPVEPKQATGGPEH